MLGVKDDKGYNQGYNLVPSTKIRMMRRADFFLQAMDDVAGKTALEIGCGRGEVSNWIAEKTTMNVLGTDICVPFIEGAQQQFRRDNLSYEVLDFNNADHIMGRRFDYVFGNGILHHLYYTLDESLVKIRQLLQPGGKMIFMEPNIYNPYIAAIFKNSFLRKKAHLEPDEMAFSASFIKEKLEQAGFGNVQVTYRDFLLPGIPLFLVKPSVALGNVAEKIPVIKQLSQSIFIEATNK